MRQLPLIGMSSVQGTRTGWSSTRTRRTASITIVAAFICGCAADVTAPDTTPASVTLSPATPTTLQAGKSVQLTAVVKNKGGTVLSAAVAYSSSASNIVQVSSTGLLTASGPVGTATVTATAGSVGSTPLPVNVIAADAQGIAVATPLPANPVAGSTNVVTAKVTDSFGNPVAGTAVTFAVTAGSGTVTPAGTATDSAGAVSATFKLGNAVGTNTLIASVASLSSGPATFSAASVAGPLAALTRIGSDPAGLFPGATAGDSLRVQATDALGNPKAGVTIVFSVTGGGGSASPLTAVTDVSGKAATQFTTGPAIGTNTATASTAGIATVSFSVLTVARTLTASTYATGTASKPIVVVDNGDKIKVSTFTSTGRAGATFTETGYVDTQRGIDVVVSYSGADVPTTLYDKKTGETVSIVQRDNRVDYLIFNASGQYTMGLAVIAQASKLYVAKILANPTINGQLSGSSDKLSFSLLARAQSGLGPLVEAPPALSAFFTQTAGKALASVSSGALPSRAAADALVTQRSMALALSTDVLRRSLTQAGLLLIGSAVALPVLGISAGALPLGLFCSGLGAIAIANVPNFHLDALDQLNDAFGKFFDDGVTNNASPSESVATAMQSINTSGSLVLSGLSKLVNRVGDAAKDALAAFVPSSSIPAESGGPPSGGTDLDGYAVDQTNTIFPLSGTASSTGQVSASGTNVTKTVTVGGSVTGSTFTGTYSGTIGSGSITGSVTKLGTCQTQQASGGQGTFAQAFNMGTSSGSVSFSYDAFSIPDAFTVATNGQTVFTTGGPVSNTGGSTFSLSGSSIVFVTVSAPLSGTAWNFTLGCPQ